MRRIAVIGVVAVALAVALLATGAEGDGGPTDDYQVRAYFDNAGFLVEGEEVRVAGATVGTIDSVDVTKPGEPVYADGRDDPGKAVIVLNITDPGFQDFRIDASCMVRPQSLLGEKFVDCKPTEPHSAVSEPPPELEVIADGEPGAGERFLPIDNNGKAVDIDLVNNIYRDPEVDKFRLILNDLGAGLAARGKSLSEVIERANPALKETDEVLKILADQNTELAQLAADSDTVLQPLARERDHIAGFINNAAIAGGAAAERRADIERGFEEFPNALDQLQSTMVELRRFEQDATPVAADLRRGAAALTGSTKALGKFAEAGTPALISLGDAADTAGPDLVASRDLINDLGKLGSANISGAEALENLLLTLRKSGGRDYLYKTILGLSNALNGYDSYGHYLRSVVQLINCADIVATPVPGCQSTWNPTVTASNPLASLTGQAAINANPKPDQLIPPPYADESGVAATEETAQQGKQGSKRGDRQIGAAKDLFGFLTDDAATGSSDDPGATPAPGDDPVADPEQGR